MLSFDTNLLFYARSEETPEYEKASAWLTELNERNDVVLSELMLVEFYRLLRNPKTSKKPYSPAEAVSVIESFRRHPHWRIVGFSPAHREKEIHDKMWNIAAGKQFACRRICDVRLALSLQSFGVTRFATHNKNDFLGLGFKKVFNPLSD